MCSMDYFLFAVISDFANFNLDDPKSLCVCVSVSVTVSVCVCVCVCVSFHI